MVLALGTVLCCAFIAACVYWTATQRASPDVNESLRERFSSQEEADWLGANNGQKGRAVRHQKKHHARIPSGGARAYAQRSERAEFRGQPSQSGRMKGGLWESVQGRIDEVSKTFKGLATRFRSSEAAEFLSVFDVSAESASDALPPNTTKRNIGGAIDWS